MKGVVDGALTVKVDVVPSGWHDEGATPLYQSIQPDVDPLPVTLTEPFPAFSVALPRFVRGVANPDALKATTITHAFAREEPAVFRKVSLNTLNIS